MVAFAKPLVEVRIDDLRDAALSWHIPPPVPLTRGVRLFMDAGPNAPLAARVTREILRANTRIAPPDALALAARAVLAARDAELDPAFVAATILQESAFEPRAISGAGAVGIAQFTVGTARLAGIDPWDPSNAIGGAVRLLASYVTGYRRYAADPYALADAAYNAGPGAVRAYGGVPPYAETRGYVQDIRERWSRIVGR